MKIGTNGIVTDEWGQVLLIQRDDTRLLAPPGGALDAGELPTEGVVREVREETGLIVMPVRLAAVFFWPVQPEGFLSFIFRCLRRGGELTPSNESLRVGFFPTNPLPGAIFSVHRERLVQALIHQGGPPYWGLHRTNFMTRLGRSLLFNVIYPWKDWRRRRRGEPPYQPPPSWQLSAFAVVRNQAGEALWLRRPNDSWRLPGGSSQGLEAPWEMAARATRAQIGQDIRLTDLTGVYVDRSHNRMNLVFTGVPAGAGESHKRVAGTEAPELAYFSPGQEPESSVRSHSEYIVDATSAGAETLFRVQGE